MNSKVGALLVVGLLSVILVGERLERFSPIQTSQAQSTKNQEARKWEYCIIAGVSYDPIAYLTGAGRRLEAVDGGRGNDPLPAAFAKLGSEGWEMVGQMQYTNQSEYRPDTFFFKRLAP
jgi:hypothetical protein